MIGLVHSIETLGAADGPGLRYILFLRGCPLRCAYCHNPDTWDMQGGSKMTEWEMFNDIMEYKHFLKRGGVTISGGEPLMQWQFCYRLTKLLHEEDISVAIDTSGAIALKHCQPLIDEIDLILLDIKAMDTELCRKLTGEGNEHALEILDYCEKIGKPVWIRHVVVPGLTLEEKNLSSMAEHIKKYSCIQRVDLLAFHHMAQYKWDDLKLNYTLKDTPTPTKEEMQWAADIFAKKGIKVNY